MQRNIDRVERTITQLQTDLQRKQQQIFQIEQQSRSVKQDIEDTQQSIRDEQQRTLLKSTELESSYRRVKSIRGQITKLQEELIQEESLIMSLEHTMFTSQEDCGQLEDVELKRHTQRYDEVEAVRHAVLEDMFDLEQQVKYYKSELLSLRAIQQYAADGGDDAGNFGGDSNGDKSDCGLL